MSGRAGDEDPYPDPGRALVPRPRLTEVLGDDARSLPRLVLVSVAGGGPAGDVGLFTVASQLSGVGYLGGGGVLFGIALLRARILARWAAALLAVATGSTVLLQVLPYSYHRLFAVPTGVALIWLGISLWRDQRHQAHAASMTVSVSAPSGQAVR